MNEFDVLLARKLGGGSGDTYTKAQIDTMMAGKLNISDIDSTLSTTSENPVQNKVLAAILNHFTFSVNSKHYYLQPEQPSNPQDGDIWIG